MVESLSKPRVFLSLALFFLIFITFTSSHSHIQHIYAKITWNKRNKFVKIHKMRIKSRRSARRKEMNVRTSCIYRMNMDLLRCFVRMRHLFTDNSVVVWLLMIPPSLSLLLLLNYENVCVYALFLAYMTHFLPLLVVVCLFPRQSWFGCLLPLLLAAFL